MNQVVISAAITPEMLSARWPGMSEPLRFFSTTFELTMKSMYGEMVVPTFATSSDTYPGSLENCGITVSLSARPQSGLAMKPLTI